MLLADQLVDGWLAEDAPYGDLTTRALGIGERCGVMHFSTRTEAVVSAVEEAERLLVRHGAEVLRWTRSGERVQAGTKLLEAKGPAAVLHLMWRTAQTMMEHASGIATATAEMLAEARRVAPDVIVECTRKGMPGSRALVVRAVLSGGGTMHRLGLSESILIFAEHSAFVGGWTGMRDSILTLKRTQPGKKITAEAHTVETALRMVEAGVDVIQLDKFPPDAVSTVIAATRGSRPPPVVAVAGGVHLGNAAAYAATGCDVLVTSAPLWSPPLDIGVSIEPI